MSAKDQLWIEAAKRYRLSAEQVRMARELGMNPKKLGGLANHKQEPWKTPLPQFIEDLYERRFQKKKHSPEVQKRSQQAVRPASARADELPF